MEIKAVSCRAVSKPLRETDRSHFSKPHQFKKKKKKLGVGGRHTTKFPPPPKHWRTVCCLSSAHRRACGGAGVGPGALPVAAFWFFPLFAFPGKTEQHAAPGRSRTRSARGVREGVWDRGTEEDPPQQPGSREERGPI